MSWEVHGASDAPVTVGRVRFHIGQSLGVKVSLDAAARGAGRARGQLTEHFHGVDVRKVRQRLSSRLQGCDGRWRGTLTTAVELDVATQQERIEKKRERASKREERE